VELWCLLNVLLPSVLNSLQDFESWFDYSAMVSSDGMGDTISQEILQSVRAVHRGLVRICVLCEILQCARPCLMGILDLFGGSI
jgi:hypothetical protein